MFTLEFLGQFGVKPAENGMTVLLRACIDEAGTDNQHDHAVIAACIALDSDWARIESKWETNVIRRYGLTCFHAKDFNQRKGEFKNWSNMKCTRLLSAIKKILEEAPIFNVAIAINKETHKAIKNEIQGLRGFKKDSDCGLCFRAASYLACEKIAEQSPHAQIKFIVEDGPYAADIAVIYHEIKISEGAIYKPAKYAHMMCGITAAPKKSLRGLEIAGLSGR